MGSRAGEDADRRREGLHNDLDRLAKELEKEEPNIDRITKLLGRLGPATVKLADKAHDLRIAKKVRHLGQAPTDNGVESGDDEE